MIPGASPARPKAQTMETPMDNKTHLIGHSNLPRSALVDRIAENVRIGHHRISCFFYEIVVQLLATRGRGIQVFLRFSVL